MRSTEVGRDRVLSYVSDHRSGGAGGTSACSSWRAILRYPGLKRLQVGQPGSAVVRVDWPGGRPLYSRDHTEARLITCAFSMLPKEHPTGLLRWPLGSSRYTPRVKLGEPPHEWGACLRRGGVCPMPPERQAHPKAGGPQAGQVRPRRNLTSRFAECPPEWAAERRSAN